MATDDRIAVTAGDAPDDGEPWPTSEGAYRKIAKIGHGGSAQVWVAFCESKHRHVAVKVVQLDSLDDAQLGQAIDESKNGALFVHEYIVRQHTAFVTKAQLWLVSDLATCGSVVDLLRTLAPNGIDDDEVIAAIVFQVLCALKYLHDTQVIHRDVKASNVLVHHTGGVALSDLGVSRALTHGKSARTFTGTPCWMAPEVLNTVLEPTQGYRCAADIWSLGITCIELATGRPPYWEMTALKIVREIHTNEAPTLKSELKRRHAAGRRYSSNLVRFIAACLKKDPADRASAAQLLKHKLLSPFRKNPALARDVIRERLLALLPRSLSLSERYEQLNASVRPDDEAGKRAIEPKLVLRAEDYEYEQSSFSDGGDADDSPTRAPAKPVAASVDIETSSVSEHSSDWFFSDDEDDKDKPVGAPVTAASGSAAPAGSAGAAAVTAATSTASTAGSPVPATAPAAARAPPAATAAVVQKAHKFELASDGDDAGSGDDAGEDAASEE